MSLRVLYTITLAEIGGAQGHVRDLLELFSAETETAIAVGAEGPLTEAARDLGTEVYILPSLNRSIRPGRDLRAVSELRSTIRAFRPDLIHAHSSKAGLIARLAGRLESTPVIFTAHGWVFSPGAPPKTRVISWLTEFAATRLGGTLVCISEFDRQLARRLLLVRRNRIAVIPHGLPDEAPQASPAPGPLRIVMVARFQQQKDHAMLLRAVARLDTRVVVTLAGTGPLLDETRQLAKELGVEQRVRFVGNRDDVPELLADSDIFVLFSRYEGLPISIMEAMRAGLPVIATDVCGVAEQVEHGVTGILVSPGDDLSAAHAIAELAENPLLRLRLGAAGRKKFMREYTRPGMHDRYRLLYGRFGSHDLVDRKPTRSDPLETAA